MHISFRILTFLLLSMVPLALPPGLPIPEWYSGQLQTHPTPQIGQAQKLQLDFKSQIGALEDVQVEFHLPQGIRAINPDQRVQSFESQDSFQAVLEVVPHAEVPGLSIRATLSLSSPKDALVQLVRRTYPHEPKHAVQPLIDSIQNMQDFTQYSFGLTFYVSSTEGQLELPSPVWTPFPNTLNLPWLQWSLPVLAPEVLSQKRDKSLQSVKRILADSQSAKRIREQAPGLLRRLVEGYSLSEYNLLLQALQSSPEKPGIPTRAEQLVERLLEFDNPDYELILALHSLKALQLAQQGSLSRAIALLIETNRTVTEASSRAYLMHNLALLCLKANREESARGYFQEALRLKPGLHAARRMLSKGFDSQKSSD